ncbi:MAG: hypothetical protein ACI9N1_000062 [Flavobacteriales bacterium]|jgi:uncharacterized protein
MKDQTIIDKVSRLLAIPNKQVKNTYTLLNEGATVPFIARYRKDATGNLDEVAIDNIKTQSALIIKLRKRQEFIIKVIIEQGKLTDELKSTIENTWTENTLEDLYLPFKSQRKTKASVAIEAGLEPLAKILMAQNNTDLELASKGFISKTIKTEEEAIEGAIHIASQWISERIYVRERLRSLFWKSATISSKIIKGKEIEGEKYRDYFDYSEPVSKIKSHRLLAVLRGSNEGVLRMKCEPDKSYVIDSLKNWVAKNGCDEWMEKTISYTYSKQLKPSISKEILNEIKAKADIEAIQVFGQNLKQLLLQAPLGGYRILAIDPGFKSGCKVVCLNSNGDLLGNTNIYPHPPQKDTTAAMKKISTMVEQYKIEAIAIGNGTASRETERFIKNTHFDRQVKVFVVNEAGASIYSASKVAREEFPEYDITVRGAASIGRRLMDPLAELVKIDPKSIGVGQYQHDVDPTLLQESLDAVIVSCVNKVGVDLNTASKYLLNYVSGIGPKLSENIVNYRTEIGKFENRQELKKVTKLGSKAFEQCAGFLRINSEINTLDSSGIHPESYDIVKAMAKSIQIPLEDFIENEAAINRIIPENFITEIHKILSINDILSELKKPGRDPRQGIKVFEFDPSLRSISDLKIGATIPGIVNNITNFGAFVDIGIKENGLIHISNLSNEFISDPTEIIKLHEHISVEVISVDVERKRIGLKRINE